MIARESGEVVVGRAGQQNGSLSFATFFYPKTGPCFRFDGFRNPSIFSMDSESCWIIFSFLQIANLAEKSICQNIAGL